jgi:two-component system OmpR family sensor kinase
MTRLSLRMRLTAWYTVALVVVLCVGGADVLWVQGQLGVRRVDRELDATTTTLANVIRAEIDEHAAPPAAAEEARATVAAPERAVAILDGRGVPLAATWNGLTLSPDLLDRQGASASTLETPTGAWRLHVRSEAFAGTPMTLVLASPLEDVRREQRQVAQAMVIGIPIALLVAVAGGLWLATIGLRPIADMARQASALAPTGSERLAGHDRTDEIGLLARAFNGLLGRLRATLGTQRQFMADASHELRTPVSIIRTAADVALNRDRRTAEEYRHTLGIIRSESERLSRLVADMLVLARADAGGYPLRLVDLYLDDIVSDCRRAVEVLAAQRGVTVRSGACPEVAFRGDEDLLRQLVVNVLTNAVQHTPAGGVVTTDVTQNGSEIAIRIADTGAGIPAADRERIFDRFVQLDAARRGIGTGLGLPIARWIAEAHRGSLVLEDSGPGGSRFCVRLPATAAADAWT